MSNVKIVLLQHETPSEQTLILVFHFMYEGQWIVVTEDDNWHICRRQIHLKVLKSKNKS